MSRPWTIHTGDCRDALAAMDAESIDACVTDTPYGLSTILDPANLDREALWQKINAGEAELPIVRLLRSWLDTGENPIVKGRGFMGKEWDALVPAPNTWRALWRVMKPGAYLFAFGGTRTADLITMSIRLAGFEVEDTIAWMFGSGFPKRVRLDLAIDTALGMKAQRPIHGPRPAPSGTANIYSAMAPRDEQMVTGAATPEAARFVGHDRALRPGNEPIIVAEKPRLGTVAANAMRYGTGGLNVDGCRIPRGDIPDSTRPVGSRPMFAGMDAHERGPWKASALGGYPANVILDEETERELDQQAGYRHGPGGYSSQEYKTAAYEGGFKANMVRTVQEPGGGGASRFFYTAKASTSERDKGLEDLPTLTPGERSGGREEDSAGINGYAGTRGENGRNPGPCVKPISLMRYLVRLASPPGAWDPDISRRPVILDIFAGSGSTLVAGLVEGVRVVGCELDPEMSEVARRRCQHAYALPAEDETERPVTRVGGQASLAF
jgi:DNA modification methylase